MKRRAGFTLIEVTVALVVSGLVVLLAYAAAQAGTDTQARLLAHRSASESMVTFRAMLADALRHAMPGLRGGPVVFELHDRMGISGQESDSLVFATRGLVPPYGTSGRWTAVLALHGDTLRLTGWPEGGERGSGLRASVVGVGGLDVRALGRSSLAQWSATWSEPDVTPDAVSISLRGDGGELMGTPLVVRIGLERAP